MIIRHETQHPIAKTIMVCVLQALYKSRLIISLAGHFRGNDLIAEGKTAIALAEPELTSHRITTGIPGKTAFGHIELQAGGFAGSRIRRKDRLQEPGSAQRRGVRRLGHDSLRHRILWGRAAGRRLASQQKEPTRSTDLFHDGIFTGFPILQYLRRPYRGRKIMPITDGPFHSSLL
jgi:hypothetical protein